MSSLLHSSAQLFSELQEKINLVKLSHTTPLQQSEAAIAIILKYLRDVRKLLRSCRNLPVDQEIVFFKEVKPKFMAEYLYHAYVYRLHLAWPMGDFEVQQAYLEDGLKQVHQFFERNHQFYCYFRTNRTTLDNKYFVRGKEDPEPTIDHLICKTDPAFYTSRDFMVAQILANNQLQEYLQAQLVLLKHQQDNPIKSEAMPVLVWSESKSALMELIYGLHLSRALNGGNADIKTIVAVLGKTFGVDLKNFYDFFYHIKMRKLEPTKFTDRMKLCLLQKYEES